MRQSLLRLEPTPCKMYLLKKTPLSIGRGLDCDLVLDDESASREHARIEITMDAVSWVVDTKSLNGVLVNERRIQGAQQLRHLDVITVGRTRFRFFEAEAYQDSDLGFSN
ncbi:FHA domain-containing protein [Variovorax sp. RTB1]|jgi:pSer/pThr/pTyr-binding forkhead associated (FHA) protein|uniref:FHA domain-containing protein n=1 Tax=Variovorax sp. RTB1 TaxID=3048631 RepID=UPI002B2286CE|nr:FHA domain-containing protein [Variovorax sp. RTB1]MEB0112650.1 FHA domain-containing protein [Variovorax sp. RTB1]